MPGLRSHKLNIADTRPPLTWGLPHAWVVAFFLVACLIGIWTPGLGQMLGYEAALFCFWPVAQAIVRLDYNGDRVLMLWWRSAVLSGWAKRWGGASPAAFPIKPSWHGRGRADV